MFKIFLVFKSTRLKNIMKGLQWEIHICRTFIYNENRVCQRRGGGGREANICTNHPSWPPPNTYLRWRPALDGSVLLSRPCFCWSIPSILGHALWQCAGISSFRSGLCVGTGHFNINAKTLSSNINKLVVYRIGYLYLVTYIHFSRLVFKIYILKTDLWKFHTKGAQKYYLFYKRLPIWHTKSRIL